MSEPRRAPDGRFLPQTGDIVLPPKKQGPRDEHGRYLKRERVQSSKPYSRAVRELLEAKETSIPLNWDKENLTEAQALAMVHMSQAKSGNVQVGLMIIDRAEGKVPQAAEDREAAIKAGTGIKLLAELLGLPTVDVIDAEIVEEQKCLEPSSTESFKPESPSPEAPPLDSSSTSSSEFSSEGQRSPDVGDAGGAQVCGSQDGTESSS